LRLVDAEGAVLASVSLLNTAPHWPARAPATDWARRRIVVHREGERVLAYLVAVRVSGHHGSFAWLEGHVRAEDFQRLFAIPQHLMGGAESAILERSGATVYVAHEHATSDLTTVLRQGLLDSTAVTRAGVAGAASLVASAPVVSTNWVLTVYLPLDVALAPLVWLRNGAVAGAVILVALIVATGAVAAGSVTTPLRELAAAAGRFGKGRSFSPVPEQHARDEVGELIRSFNRMASDLGRSWQEIERLHARELERAQQLATVGELATGVAHEIRNPLTGVLGAVELALRTIPPGDSSRPLLEEAQTQLQRIETATTQLLRYARPPELRDVVVDANLIVDRAARLVEAQVSNAGIVLRTEQAPAAVPVRVDPELIVQVLVNLILNGVEAMRAGGELTVWVGRHAPEVWIGVRDMGPGVPHDKRTEIFRPFFTTKHQGTGLGLSISQQIVSRHGGTLRVEDTPGGGATFVIALPFVGDAGGNRD
jgi:signal transduction histidine kinase